MRAFVHRSLAVAVVLVTATLPLLAQGVGSVVGRVSDERGVPLEGVEIAISGPGILGTMWGWTDREGRYSVPGVPGQHPLTIRAEGTGRVAMTYVGHTARRNGVLRVNFTLRRPGDHDVLVLVEAGVPYHQAALDGARSTMPGRVSTMVVLDDSPTTARLLRVALEGHPNAVLAIGETAARVARRYIQDVPIVHAMVPGPTDAGLVSTNMCGVPLNGGFARQMEHLRHVVPGARSIGTIYAAGRMDATLQDLRRAAEGAGLEVAAVDVHPGEPDGVSSALDQLRSLPLDAFVVLMDPRLIDADGFERIAAFARTREVILAVPDASLAQGELSFSFTAGFWEMGAFAGTLVRRIVEGKEQPADIGLVSPDRGALAFSRVERQDPRELLAAAENETLVARPAGRD
ncbi:MAG: ABC transporter substrate binding protein [Candidatus Polarisedimenticolia bacterium]